MKTLSGKLTYANVISTICLFLLLGGGAAIASSQLGKNTVGPKQLKKNAVTTAKVKNAAITGGKLAGASVTGSKLAADAVTGDKVKDGSLSAADIDQASLTGVRASNVIAISITNDENCSPLQPLPAGVSIERPQQGDCKMTLPASLESCAAVATVKFHPGSISAVGPRTAYISTKIPSVLTIRTFTKEEPENLAFDLVLVC